MKLSKNGLRELACPPQGVSVLRAVCLGTSLSLSWTLYGFCNEEESRENKLMLPPELIRIGS